MIYIKINIWAAGAKCKLGHLWPERCGEHQCTVDHDLDKSPELIPLTQRQFNKDSATNLGTHMNFTSVPGLVAASCYTFLGLSKL